MLDVLEQAVKPGNTANAANETRTALVADDNVFATGLQFSLEDGNGDLARARNTEVGVHRRAAEGEAAGTGDVDLQGVSPASRNLHFDRCRRC